MDCIKLLELDDIIFGSTKKSLCTKFEKMMHKKFQMSSMGELTFFLGLQVKQKDDGIFIRQDKYVTKILKKFGFSDVKTASMRMETHKPLLKDADGENVDEHLYRSMIGSLMYLTSSRLDIMFAVCACARFQFNPKSSHLHAVKRIFRYLKGQPKLGLWYPKDSPFDLVAYTDSDYAGASLDRKFTIGAEYIAASNCCGQSTICIVKNPVFHLKTKHIEIRHHFIRDSYEKKLIQMIKIHTDQNVADLLIKAFDVNKFQYLIARIKVNAGNSKLMMLGINLLMLEKVNVVRRNLLLLVDNVKEKTINGEVQLQALVDKKNVIITESTIRRDLQLEDAEGTECLPTATIFEELTRMRYEILTQKLTFYKAFFSPQWKFLIHTILQCLSAKTTAWNEFSSTMASAIICLATNQKFNFSKYIFDNMVKNLEGGVKFLMYPRFVQVFLDKQVGDMTTHNRIYDAPCHTKKIFANMKREGKGFFGRVTPLFQTMMVQAQEEGEGSTMPTDPQHTPTITQPSTSQPQKKQPRRKHRKDIEVPQPSDSTEPIADEAPNDENVTITSND
ncbi:putative ribonuclease H-like domain-containing protein, partial [Tanacetum coccineum]